MLIALSEVEGMIDDGKRRRIETRRRRDAEGRVFKRKREVCKAAGRMPAPL